MAEKEEKDKGLIHILGDALSYLLGKKSEKKGKSGVLEETQGKEEEIEEMEEKKKDSPEIKILEDQLAYLTGKKDSSQKAKTETPHGLIIEDSEKKEEEK
jgi:hypothetical protein